MGKKHEFYFRNIARRWQQEVARANGRVFIISPYLTSPTAETVIGKVPVERCLIFTRFEVEDFAQGGSSLATLRRLCERGFAVFEVKGLHAKAVVVPGYFASVGSQNLTAGGTHNQEASAVFTEPEDVARVAKFAESLSDVGKQITLARIADIEKDLSAIAKIFKRGKKEARALQTHADAAEKARQFEKDKQEALQRMRAALRRLKKRSATVRARVTNVEQSMQSRNFFDFSSSSQRSLLAPPGVSLTRWDVDGEVLHFWRMYRYICIEENSGRFGWARVGKTRITKISDGIEGWDLNCAGRNFKMDAEAQWKDGTEATGNLQLTISPVGGVGALSVKAWFAVDELSIIAIDIAVPSRAVSALRAWIDSNRDEFRENVLEQITAPFRYKHNLTGAEADTFLGPLGSKYELSVRLLNKKPILVAKKL